MTASTSAAPRFKASLPTLLCGVEEKYRRANLLSVTFAVQGRPEMTDSPGEIRTRDRGAGGILLKCRLWVRCERQR